MDDDRVVPDEVLERKKRETDKLVADLDATIADLDVKLDRVLKKQEHDYLKGYTMYVKQKEHELRELITKLNDKNSNASLKDTIIQEQLQAVKLLTKD
jgi:hypothetical protein